MQYVEILADGITMRGSVRMAGQLVAVPDEVPLQAKSKQVERWGSPRYKKISKAEFEDRGGSEDPGGAPEFTTGVSRDRAAASGDEFAILDGKNVEATLAIVADFDDAQTQRFIRWEQENANRKTVLEALGASQT